MSSLQGRSKRKGGDQTDLHEGNAKTSLFLATR